MSLTRLSRSLAGRRIMMILVPTTEIVGDLISSLKQYECLDPNLDMLFDRLMSKISYRDIALDMLKHDSGNYQRVIETIVPEYSENIKKCYLNAGVRLIDVLDSLGAYEKNYLIYWKKGWMGNSLVLEKIDIKEIPRI